MIVLSDLTPRLSGSLSGKGHAATKYRVTQSHVMADKGMKEPKLYPTPVRQVGAEKIS